MKLFDMLKSAFPKPQLPQKRYMLIAMIIYMGLKAYTSWTPTPDDDYIPERFKQAVMLLSGDDIRQAGEQKKEGG